MTITTAENDVPADELGGACWSQPEAKAKAVATVSGWVGDLGWRRKGWVNAWRAAVNDPGVTPLLAEAVAAGNPKGRTTVGRVRELLNVLASKTSWDGKDPVFLKRETLAVEMGVSVSVVKRCFAAAECSGLLTEGFQQRWLESQDDGDPRWVSSSAVRMLLLPVAVRELRREVKRQASRVRNERARRRVHQVELQQLADKQAADDAHRERMDALEYPVTSRPADGVSKVVRSQEMTGSLAAARRALE